MRGIEITLGKVEVKQTYNLIVSFYNPWTLALHEIENKYGNEHMQPRIFPRKLEFDESCDYLCRWIKFISDEPFRPAMADRLAKHVALLEVAYEYFKTTEHMMDTGISTVLTDEEFKKRYHTRHCATIEYNYPHIQHLLIQDYDMAWDDPGKILPQGWELDHAGEKRAHLMCDEPFDPKLMRAVIHRIVLLEKAFDHMTKD